MKVTNLYSPEISGQWDFDGTVDMLDLNWRSPEEVCGHFHPYARVNMQQIATLNEATYKQLGQLIDPNFLKQGIRAAELKGVFIRGFKPENTLNFHVPSSEVEKNRINYTNSVLFDQWEEYGSDANRNFMERSRLLLLDGDVRLHCTCPSFLYWGYQYILTVLDAAIYPEDRHPRIRNPAERGIVCKHLNKTLRVLPFHSADIAKEMKSQFG